MTSVGPLVSSPGERFVTLGSVAIRPVAYRGETSAGRLMPRPEPIEGLVVVSASSRRTALLRFATNVYGLLDLAPGVHRVHITDPKDRFLPRAITVAAPDRRPLADAIVRRAAELPEVDDPPLDIAWLRPSPRAPRGPGLFGVVRDAAGALLPLAWIRVDTLEKNKLVGRFVTYADERGEYVVPLPLVRHPGAGDPKPVIKVRAHRLRAATPVNADWAALFPAHFDDLSPEVSGSGFNSVYEATALFNKAVHFNAGTSVRLDLQPA